MILTFIFLLNLFSIVYAIKNDRYDIADVLWGLNILLFCLNYVDFDFSSFNLNYLSIIFVLIWGLRLSYHIGFRFLKKNVQDQRYVDLIKTSKNNLFKISKVFFLQIILAFLMSATFWNFDPLTLSKWSILLGGLLFIIGFGFEVVVMVVVFERNCCAVTCRKRIREF